MKKQIYNELGEPTIFAVSTDAELNRLCYRILPVDEWADDINDQFLRDTDPAMWAFENGKGQMP